MRCYYQTTLWTFYYKKCQYIIVKQISYLGTTMIGKCPVFTTRHTGHCRHSFWKLVRKFWSGKFGIFLTKFFAVFLLIILNPAMYQQKIGTVFVTFSWQKNYQQVWQFKKDLRKLKMEHFDLPGSIKLFLDRNLWPTTKYYGQTARNYITLVKFIAFSISGDIIKIKVNEKFLPPSVTHVDNFQKSFQMLIFHHPHVKSMGMLWKFIV